MHDNGRDTRQLRRSIDNVDEVLPCPFRNRVIRTVDGKTVMCCTHLDKALGWQTAVSTSLCVDCAAHHGTASNVQRREMFWLRNPEKPTAQGADPLSILYRFAVLHPLRSSTPDNILKQTMGLNREECIERAKQEHISPQEILNALVVGVNASRLNPKQALDMAERHKLLNM